MTRREFTTHGPDYGYSEDYWDCLPDEVKERIVREQDGVDDFEPLEPQFDPQARREYLEHTLSAITDANRGRGVRSMTKSHPKFSEIDARYDIDSVRRSSVRSEREAARELQRACGECAVAGCVMRDNFKEFDKKYHFKPARDRLQQKLDQDPTAPC